MVCTVVLIVTEEQMVIWALGSAQQLVASFKNSSQISSVACGSVYLPATQLHTLESRSNKVCPLQKSTFPELDHYSRRKDIRITFQKRSPVTTVKRTSDVCDCHTPE